MKIDLGHAIQIMRPPPCEHPMRCHHWERCAKERLACEMFAAYISGVNSAPRRHPSRVIYERVMSPNPEAAQEEKSAEREKILRGFLVSRRTVSDSMLGAVLAWKRAGMCAQVIAKKLNRPVNTIKGWICKLESGQWEIEEIPEVSVSEAELTSAKHFSTWNRRSVEPELLRQVRDLHKAGYRICDIAAEIGRSRKTVAAWLRYLRDGSWSIPEARSVEDFNLFKKVDY